MDSQYYNNGKTTIFDEKQFTRRFNHAKNEREVYSHNHSSFDVEIKGNQPYVICDRLDDYILPRLMVMPNSPDRIPGPLSDGDIEYMLEKREKDKLIIRKEGVVLSVENLKSQNRLSGCTIQLSLAETIRVITKPFIHNYIDMGQDEQTIDAKLADVYKEKNISKGYVLRPDETILCSSAEQIKLPHDIYAIVSSRFSYTQLGLSIELGTSIIQPGHDGKVHFQIKNDTKNSICIYPGIQVVQLILFRTIQPSSAVYRNNKGTHSYDSESISPISRFRRNNSELNEVKKPGANFIKNVFETLKNKIIETIIGFLSVSGAAYLFYSKLEYLLNTFFVPMWNMKSALSKCMIIAISGSFFCNVFSFIGKLVLYFLYHVLSKIRDVLR